MIGAFRSSRQRNVTEDQIHVVHECAILKNHILIRTFRYLRQDHQDNSRTTAFFNLHQQSTRCYGLLSKPINVTTEIYLIHTFPTSHAPLEQFNVAQSLIATKSR